jgi:hypothetical protein
VSNLKWVADDPTPLEKLLLDASRAEQPSDEHQARLRSALGIGVPLPGPLPPAAGSVHTAPASVAPPSLAVAVATAKSATLAKVGLGVALLAALGALVFSRSAAEQAPASTPSAANVAKLAAAPLAAAPLAEPLAPAAPAPASVEASPPRSGAAAAAVGAARGESSAARGEDLSEQIRLIEAARAGVAARDSKAAFSALDSYAAKFPRGSFGQEAQVLRIRALDQSGDSGRASALAKAFVTRFPNSPHLARIKPIAERASFR